MSEVQIQDNIEDEIKDKRFGEIAIDKQLVTKEKIDRALVIQRCINNRTQVYMPIGAVLQKMGVLTKEQVDEILSQQSPQAVAAGIEHVDDEWSDPVPADPTEKDQLDLVVSPDKMTVTIAPIAENLAPPSMTTIKMLMVENNLDFGVVSDKLIEAHLQKTPMPMEPFIIAKGIPPVPGKPPEIQYYFDTDPIRIGTLLEDGSMDWKNRGEIPQVVEGELLAEKVGGEPGKPGTDIFGQEVLPPRVKEPSLKFTKGATRSEDSCKIFAKINGTPRLQSDGRIGVSGVLAIDSDVGVETGNIDFEGHVDVNGCIESGYTIKGGSLSTREIQQNAIIEINHDMVVYGGVYGSTIKVGGHLKASHIHNCTVEVLGDLAVEKELFNCTIEVNGRCLIESGKIIGCKIQAKKGIQAKDIGTRAAKANVLTVGVDFKSERDIQACKDEIKALEDRKKETEQLIQNLENKQDQLDAQLGTVAQEQDGCMVQKRQLEEKLNSPAMTQNEEKKSLLKELIADLAQRYDVLDKQVQGIMAKDDLVRKQMAQKKSELPSFDEQMQALQEKMELIEEAAKLDPGIPVIKANGMVYAKTLVNGPHRKMILPEDMKCVRIAETQEEGKHYIIKISNLR